MSNPNLKIGVISPEIMSRLGIETIYNDDNDYELIVYSDWLGVELLRNTAFINHPKAPTYYFGFSSLDEAKIAKDKWNNLLSYYYRPTHEKDYIKPEIRIVSFFDATEMFGIGGRNWKDYTNQTLAIFRLYDRNQKLTNRLDLLYLKSGTGRNLSKDVWVFLDSKII